MKADTLIREEGMQVLFEKLGLVGAERFISLVIREPFNYTEWQRDLYNDLSVKQLCQKADEYWQKTHDAE